jgi:hypothetical protein
MSRHSGAADRADNLVLTGSTLSAIGIIYMAIVPVVGVVVSVAGLATVAYGAGVASGANNNDSVTSNEAQQRRAQHARFRQLH